MGNLKYIELELVKAENIDAHTSFFKSRTKIYGVITFKKISYRSETIEDMGQKPIWTNSRNRLFHFNFDTEDDKEDYILIEIYNRDKCIGKSKLRLSEFCYIEPGSAPSQKTLPVFKNARRETQSGQVILKAQINKEMAKGVLGYFQVQLQQGKAEKLTSFLCKRTKIEATVTYKYTICTSGVLENQGNKFVWQDENAFLFIVHSIDRDDKVSIDVSNKGVLFGTCEIPVTMGSAASHTNRLYLDGKPIKGEITVATSFIIPVAAEPSAPPMTNETWHQQSRPRERPRVPDPGRTGRDYNDGKITDADPSDEDNYDDRNIEDAFYARLPSDDQKRW